MENQLINTQTTELSTSPTKEIRFLGQPISLPESAIRNLPKLIKLEIASPTVNHKELGSKQRQKTIEKLISIYDINFKVVGERDGENLTDQTLRTAEFASELQRFNLTYNEVIEAYRLASEGALRDHNGDIINFYPTLSVAQGAKILKAYQEYKLNHSDHTKGLEQLKKIVEKQKEADKDFQEKKWNHEFDMVVQAILTDKVTHDACKYFDYAISKGGLKDFVENPEFMKKMLNDKMQEIYTNEADKANSYLITKQEIEFLKEHFENNSTDIDVRGKEAYDRIYHISVAQIKNQLVTDWIKENFELKKTNQ